MNMPVKIIGGDPSDGRQVNDFYPTPPECTQALLTVFTPDKHVWEPMAGEGHITKVLEGAGHVVFEQDLIRGDDFFALDTCHGNCIVTNPPFNLAAETIEHAFKRGVTRMALLVKATFWHAKRRHPLFLKHRPSAIYPMLWRPDFMKRGAPTMDFIWCVWETPCAEKTIYQPLEKARVALAEQPKGGE